MPKILQIELMPDRRVKGQIFAHETAETNTGLNFFDADESRPGIEIREVNAAEIYEKTRRIRHKIEHVLKAEIHEMEATFQFRSDKEPTPTADGEDVEDEENSFDFRATLEDGSKVTVNAFGTPNGDDEFIEGSIQDEDGEPEESNDLDSEITKIIFNKMDEMREVASSVLSMGHEGFGTIEGIHFEKYPRRKIRIHLADPEGTSTQV